MTQLFKMVASNDYEGLEKVLVTDGLKDGELVVSDNGLLLAREFRNAQDSVKPLSANIAPPDATRNVSK